jgi:hypothetical protein
MTLDNGHEREPPDTQNLFFWRIFEWSTWDRDL